jgi:hypothetical protein
MNSSAKQSSSDHVVITRERDDRNQEVRKIGKGRRKKKVPVFSTWNFSCVRVATVTDLVLYEPKAVALGAGGEG